MPMKRIHLDFQSDSSVLKESILTVGCFDGIHKGHQQIIFEVQRESKKKKVPSCLCLFEPHPLEILQPEKKIKKLFTIDETEKILKPYKLDYLGVIPFDHSFSRQSSEQFIHQMISKLNPSCLVVGYDFSFGADRKGNIKDLIKKGKEFQFEVKQIPALILENQPVSSSRIRNLLSLGKMEEVAHLLGYKFFIMSSVIKGKGRGKTLGFPTANLSVDQKNLPKKGVYAARVKHQNKWYTSVLNIGNQPTFSDSTEQVLEVHIIGENFDLYGSTIILEWGNFLREERVFSSVSGLKNQIQSDIQKTLNIFYT